MLDTSHRPGPVAPARAETVARYSGFRPEVQGLRAVAVLLVVVYHVFMGRVSGGVDIFLAISAFFMTLSFVRRIEGDRHLNLGRYWLHTFKRLLPLATLVILGTLVLLALFYPANEVPEYRGHALASVFYVENWRLASESVDYYAADHSTASPFQHFWSLSVQGQVFLAWPLIFWAAWRFRRRTGRSTVPFLAVCFGLVFAASLVFSVITTHTDQTFAYFDTRARLWEFALGSLLALAIPYLKPSRLARLALGWLGIAGMISVGVLVDVQGAFPGWVALWPLLSAAAIIVAGQSGSPVGFDRFLSWRPVVKMGDAAYALYLVHWPLLITYLVVRDRPEAGPRSGVVLVVVSIVLAVVLTKLVEDPFKNWAWPEKSKLNLGIVIAMCFALVAAVTLSWSGAAGHQARKVEAAAVVNNPGARALDPGFVFEGDPGAPTIPLASELKNQWVGLPEECSGRFEASDPVAAGMCRQDGEVSDPAKIVVVVGNSHMEQFMGAVIPVAEQQNWQLVSLLQPGCGFGLEGQSEACRKGNDAAMKYVEDLHPDAVLTTATRGERMAASREHVVAGLEQIIDRLTGSGINVVGFRDNPRLGSDLSRCARTEGAEDPSCAVPVSSVLAAENPAAPLERIPGYTNIDLTDRICPDGSCEPVIGNVFVWLDHHHLTWDYTKTLQGAVRDELVRAVAG